MKLVHLSDLHLGKRVNEFSMLEDQRYILAKILQIIEEEAPDGVLIAGDIYDKSVPAGEAVQLFDDFLCRLAKQQTQVFIISGNHDSPERMAFGSRLMDASGVHISPVYQGEITPFTMEDAYGRVDIFMLPFLKPAHVRRFYEEEEIESYTDALQVVIEHMKLQPEHRSVLVAHQFVTGASRSESEEITVGGTDNIDASVFKPFDYVALGHIHGPQSVERPTIRYCGTPLKYSFSEAGHKKSVTVVELLEKGTCEIRTIPLVPIRDLRELKGTYMELTEKKNYEGTNREDYIHITLTDEEDIPDAIGKLRVIYPNLMKLDYDNRRTRSHGDFSELERLEEKTPLELFSEFYEKQNNQPMNQEQRELIKQLMEQIWEEML